MGFDRELHKNKKKHANKHMNQIKKPEVAGMFYPEDKTELDTMINRFLADAKGQNQPVPKAIIAPHAGYIYSGPIAASAYASLKNAQNKITRVIVIAPAHRYPFYGLATSSANAFSTPLGTIQVDQAALKSIASLGGASLIDAAFTNEHALEVQLPFLQTQLKNFNLIPLLAGLSNAEEVSKILEALWGNEETLIVISSDLSHYHDYKTAQRLDKKTADNILAFNYDGITSEQACGFIAICGLLKIAKQKKLRAELIDLRNSGDTEGGKDQPVVGYGAFHFYQ